MKTLTLDSILFLQTLKFCFKWDASFLHIITSPSKIFCRFLSSIICPHELRLFHVLLQNNYWKIIFTRLWILGLWFLFNPNDQSMTVWKMRFRHWVLQKYCVLVDNSFEDDEVCIELKTSNWHLHVVCLLVFNKCLLFCLVKNSLYLSWFCLLFSFAIIL